MPEAPIRLFQVDAFTDRPFHGNQAAVCVLDKPAPTAWMQALAAETDLPATAFVAPSPDPGAEWALRWFSRRGELSLCGHGTLATSHVLLHELAVSGPELRYAAGVGTLTARSAGDGAIELDLPAYPAAPAPDDTAAAAAALYPAGAAPAVTTYRGFEDLLVVVPSPADVHRSDPDGPVLGTIEARCVIVSAAGGPGAVDIVSRVFHASGGDLEDPVTGSAHCLLGPFWADRLGRTRLRARQASARGGDLEVEVRGERVALTGRAVTVLRSELTAASALPEPATHEVRG